MAIFTERSLQRGQPIRAKDFAALQSEARAGRVVASADIVPVETTHGVALLVTDRFRRSVGSNQESLFGTAAADYSSGATISLTPCDANGVATGASAETVTIPTAWGTVNLLSATVGGATTTVTCKIASGTLLQYAYAGATPYLLGLPPKQFVYDEKMTATGQQIQVAWLFGSSVSTVSAWMPVYALSLAVVDGELVLQFTPTGGSATELSAIVTEESQKTSCAQPGS